MSIEARQPDVVYYRYNLFHHDHPAFRVHSWT